MKLTKLIREMDQQPNKYEGKYFNGGFNDGVQLEPTNDGKLSLSISIYGGGDPKSINIPATGELQKLIKSYEVAFKNKDGLGTKLEPEMDNMLGKIKSDISNQVIEALKEFDMKVKSIIINTIKGNQ